MIPNQSFLKLPAKETNMKLLHVANKDVKLFSLNNLKVDKLPCSLPTLKKKKHFKKMDLWPCLGVHLIWQLKFCYILPEFVDYFFKVKKSFWSHWRWKNSLPWIYITTFHVDGDNPEFVPFQMHQTLACYLHCYGPISMGIAHVGTGWAYCFVCGQSLPHPHQENYPPCQTTKAYHMTWTLVYG